MISAPGEGSTFKVFFPAVEAPAEVLPFVSPRHVVGVANAVLLVDDDPLLRSGVRLILEEDGYSVLTAENGQAAVDVFRENPDRIAAVLLDLTMPVMGGDEAFRQIRTIKPSVPIILSSGSASRIIRDAFGAGAMPTFLQKPYNAMNLTESIRTAIRRSHLS